VICDMDAYTHSLSLSNIHGAGQRRYLIWTHTHTHSLTHKNTRSRPKMIFDMDTHTLSHTHKHNTEQAKGNIRQPAHLRQLGHGHALFHLLFPNWHATAVFGSTCTKEARLAFPQKIPDMVPTTRGTRRSRLPVRTRHIRILRL